MQAGFELVVLVVEAAVFLVPKKLFPEGIGVLGHEHLPVCVGWGNACEWSFHTTDLGGMPLSARS
jgi:hypothetical protein